MKIALICPSNMLYMPYVNNYEIILKENKVNYEIINWDRFHIEDINSNLKYKDYKTGHQRSYFDYYKYKKFILNILKSNKYDKLIIFGLQIAYFLKSYLQEKYKGRYILDIRDYNKVIKFFNIKNIIDNSMVTVISSLGYKEWLPNSDKYIINHNTSVVCFRDLKEANKNFENRKINIAYIGAIRDYKININLINSLKNNQNIELYFHGQVDINKDNKEYLKVRDIKNVVFTGRYSRQDEEKLYSTCDLINVLVPYNEVNSRTLLPNRLYNAVLYGKPMIGFEGTYLAEQIKKYKLGLVFKTFDGSAEKIINYLKEFNEEEYDKGRASFLCKVLKDNEHFSIKLKEFIER